MAHIKKTGNNQCLWGWDENGTVNLLLVGMSSGQSLLKIPKKISQKSKYRAFVWFSNSISLHLLQTPTTILIFYTLLFQSREASFPQKEWDIYPFGWWLKLMSKFLYELCSKITLWRLRSFFPECFIFFCCEFQRKLVKKLSQTFISLFSLHLGFTNSTLRAQV